jgi:hypothetical protein
MLALRGVVDDDDLEGPMILVQHRLDGPFEKRGSISRRHQHREIHSAIRARV